MKNIAQLEIVLQPPDGADKHSAFGNWQLQFLLLRLDFPHLEGLSITQAGSWKAGQGTCGMEKCLETYYGNLAGLCGKWPSLESLSVHQIISFAQIIPAYMNISGSVADSLEPHSYSM